MEGAPWAQGMGFARLGCLLLALSIWHQLVAQRRPHNYPASSCCCHDNWLPSCSQGTASSLDFPMGFLRDMN